MVVSLCAAESPLSSVVVPQPSGRAPNRVSSAGSMPPRRGVRTTHCLRSSVALLPLKCFSVVWHGKPTSQFAPVARFCRRNVVSHLRSVVVKE